MAIVTRLERKSRRWEQVWQGDAEAVANIVAGRLGADGIRTRIQGETTPYRATLGVLGGVWRILVPGGSATRARTLLRENDEGHNVIEDESGEGLTGGQRATLRFAAALGLGAILLIAIAMIVSRT